MLAHEIVHVIARHGLERSSGRYFAEMIAACFRFVEGLGEDLAMSRIHESEADYTGMVIMAEAGFDPEERISFPQRGAGVLENLKCSGTQLLDAKTDPYYCCPGGSLETNSPKREGNLWRDFSPILEHPPIHL
ncbi:hypothetical protein BJ878DRAFT_512048 [Calycina marina]|uniref:Uncharacterized protein n=1 Tax=Calycina marina TaxID=1763456 RepID=A0A9P8CE10_9HELO|nr:hypothetical protein BJ878DRAFT_512048 [Calycina marina]